MSELQTVPIGMTYIGRPYDAETAPRYYAGAGRIVIEVWGKLRYVLTLAQELSDLRETLSQHYRQLQYGASTPDEITVCQRIIEAVEQARAGAAEANAAALVGACVCHFDAETGRWDIDAQCPVHSAALRAGLCVADDDAPGALYSGCGCLQSQHNADGVCHSGNPCVCAGAV